jgi:oligopeptide/dipeptide ABC transporter ATP-binding protein
MTDLPLSPPLLRIDNLSVDFNHGRTRVIRNLSLDIQEGEVVALVGESGSGKSTAALALMGLLDPGTVRVSGSIELERKTAGRCDLLQLRERELRRIRGNDIAMIFQEPMSSLDPIYTIGVQIAEALAVHRRMSRPAIEAEALRLLQILAVPNPQKMLASYPHQLSGGMRQRAMIAMALSCRPKLLVADEPTTALDVTIQAQIIDQLKLLQRETGMAVLFITHDLGLVAEIADRVVVMYAGQIVESGPVQAVFAEPRMPYTAGLMRSRPRIGSRAADHRIAAIPGGVPNPVALPAGCSFHPRCAHFARGLCDAAAPLLEALTVDREVRCVRWREIRP